MHEKEFPSIKIGSRILVPRDNLKEWVENKMMQKTKKESEMIKFLELPILPGL